MTRVERLRTNRLPHDCIKYHDIPPINLSAQLRMRCKAIALTVSGILPFFVQLVHKPRQKTFLLPLDFVHHRVKSVGVFAIVVSVPSRTSRSSVLPSGRRRNPSPNLDRNTERTGRAQSLANSAIQAPHHRALTFWMSRSSHVSWIVNQDLAVVQWQNATHQRAGARRVDSNRPDRRLRCMRLFVLVFAQTVGVILRQSPRPPMSSISVQFRRLRGQTNSTTLRFLIEAIHEGRQRRLRRAQIG